MIDESKVRTAWLFECEDGLWMADDNESNMKALHESQADAVEARENIALHGDACPEFPREPCEYAIIPIEEYRRLVKG